MPSRLLTRLCGPGRLFRYGEYGSDSNHAALLEQEFATYLGSRYAAGVNSGGSALFVALKSIGIDPGEQVLVNAFTLAPVPGSIAHAGGTPVFVEIDENYHIDVDDLRARAEEQAPRC